jgi:hypothetical protein
MGSCDFLPVRPHMILLGVNKGRHQNQLLFRRLAGARQTPTLTATVIMLPQTRQRYRDFFHDHLVCVASIAVPSFLLAVCVVVLLRFPIGHMKAGVISNLFACYAELLAVVLWNFPLTRDHAGDVVRYEL